MSKEREFADDSLLEKLSEGKQLDETTIRSNEPKKDNRIDYFKKASSGLKASIKKSKNRDSVLLPKATENLGKEVRLKLRRMTLQEISASYAFPARADNLVSEMIRRGAEAAKSADQEFDVEVPSPQTVVEQIYGGMNREAVAALFEFQAVVCCVCCVDEDTRLFYTQEEVDQADRERPDRDNVLVWDIEDEDVAAIFDWVFDQEALAEEQIMPFRRGEQADRAVGSEQRVEAPASRADDI